MTQDRRWVHPDDYGLLSTQNHSFNLDFPPPAFVGNINEAKVIILAANGGYDSVATPQEFGAEGAENKYLERLSLPDKADWSEVAPYYSHINYSKLLLNGQAAIVNACAYRSIKISQEPENKKIIKRLPSVSFSRSWLLESVLPLAKQRRRVIVAKRHGLWQLPKEIIKSGLLIIDPAPVSPHLSKVVWDEIEKYVD